MNPQGCQLNKPHSCELNKVSYQYPSETNSNGMVDSSRLTSSRKYCALMITRDTHTCPHLKQMVAHDYHIITAPLHLLFCLSYGSNPPQASSAGENEVNAVAESRRLHRQRCLDQLEVPKDHVILTNELLGRGRFAEVFIADHNGRNAAAKVIQINHGLGESIGLDNSNEDMLEGE